MLDRPVVMATDPTTGKRVPATQLSYFQPSVISGVNTLGLVPAYDDLTAATLKADFLKLVQKLPADQQERFLKDLDQMTPARFEKGIQFIQNQLSKK